MHYLRLQRARQIAQKQWRREQKWFGHSTMFSRSKRKYKGILRKTRVFCSGPCCGNPRRHFGERTIQERKADIDMNQQLDEFYKTNRHSYRVHNGSDPWRIIRPHYNKKEHHER